MPELSSAMRDFLEKKYALLAQEQATRASEVASGNTLRTAQAGYTNAQTGAYGGISAAQIAADNARAANLNAQTSQVAPLAQSQIAGEAARTRSLNVEADWAPRRFAADIGLTGARTRTEGAQTSLMGGQAARQWQYNATIDDLRKPGVQGPAAAALAAPTPPPARPKVIQGFGLPPIGQW